MTGLYVFGYSLYYFLFKTSMTGFLQTLYFVGYMGLFAVGAGVLCGLCHTEKQAHFATETANVQASASLSLSFMRCRNRLLSGRLRLRQQDL